jgi:hypothetical protein
MLIVLLESGALIVHGNDGNPVSQMGMRQELTSQDKDYREINLNIVLIYVIDCFAKAGIWQQVGISILTYVYESGGLDCYSPHEDR